MAYLRRMPPPTQPSNHPRPSRYLLRIVKRMMVTGLIIALLGLLLYKFGPRGVPGFPVNPGQAMYAIFIMGVTFFAAGALGWLFLHEKKTQ
ncbi:MAG: hypothetical protein KGN79_10420 [Acidobacteriota bacterium]|nr:hypothetical protein [Acidobacteriota bacterium]